MTNGIIPNDILKGYMKDKDGEGTSRLQFWVLDNMRGEISDWCTAIGIIESVEHLYEAALENGNLSLEHKVTTAHAATGFIGANKKHN